MENNVNKGEELKDREKSQKGRTLEDLSEAEKECAIRTLLGVRREEDYSVLLWKRLPVRPREGSYVLVKHWDPEDGILCVDACYENGRFWFRYDPENQMELPEKTIRAWDYYPYSQLTKQQRKRQEALEFLRVAEEKYLFEHKDEMEEAD